MISPFSLSTYSYPIAGSYTYSNSITPVNPVRSISPLSDQSLNVIDQVKPKECDTCKNRKYVDVSNEQDVSFQSPAHISPEESYAVVASHEQEHVSNAIKEGNKPGNQLISSSVALKMSVCPDCGTPYVAGGVTSTTLRYNESNPYEKSRKSIEASMIKGRYVNYVA